MESVLFISNDWWKYLLCNLLILLLVNYVLGWDI